MAVSFSYLLQCFYNPGFHLKGGGYVYSLALAHMTWGVGDTFKICECVCVSKSSCYSVFILNYIISIQWNYSEGQLVFQQMGAWWVLLFLLSLPLQTTPPCCSTTFTLVWKGAHADYVQSFCTTLILLLSGLPADFDLWSSFFFHPCPQTLPSIVLTSTWHVGYIHASKTSQDITTRPLCMSPGHLFIINLLCGCWGLTGRLQSLIIVLQ